MKFGWLGFHTEGLDAARSLVDDGHQIVAVITLEESQARKRSGVADYSTFCDQHGIDLHHVKSINDPESVQLLRKLDLDILFVIGWSQIIGSEALATARVGMIGAHASPLPHNRGSAPVNWAIIKGESTGGNSLIWLSEGVDEGDLIDVRKFEITPYDTCASVYDKVAASTSDMVSSLAPRLEAGETPGQPQQSTSEPVLPRRKPSDGILDWDQPGRSIYDFIRALTRPYPGAFSWLGGEKYLVWDAAFLALGHDTGLSNGTVIGPVISPVHEACGQAVAVDGGLLIILEVQNEDGSCFSGTELADLDWQTRVWGDSGK